jgi:hypothetical protein
MRVFIITFSIIYSFIMKTILIVIAIINCPVKALCLSMCLETRIGLMPTGPTAPNWASHLRGYLLSAVYINNHCRLHSIGPTPPKAAWSGNLILEVGITVEPMSLLLGFWSEFNNWNHPTIKTQNYSMLFIKTI